MNRRSQIENVEGELPSKSAPVGVQSKQKTKIPVLTEQLEVGTRIVRTGSVRVHKRIRERVERVDLPLWRDTVDIQRVQINRPVSTVPAVRREGQAIIIPVVEEEMVVTKRLILKEEWHVTKRRSSTRAPREVTVRREEVEVERVDRDGRRLNSNSTEERSQRSRARSRDRIPRA